MLRLRLLPLVAAATFALWSLAPARADDLSFPVHVNHVSADAVAHLLDPKSNPDTPPFAFWPGLPFLKDLGPEAKQLFAPAPPFPFQMPDGVRAITSDGQNNLVLHYVPVDNLNMLSLSSALFLLDRPNAQIRVGATLWRFSDNIPPVFASMLEGWDGKTPVIKAMMEEDSQVHVITEGMKHNGWRGTTISMTTPFDMEFRANSKDAVAPQDRIRMTAAVSIPGGGAPVLVGTQRGGSSVEADTQMAALLESPSALWAPIIVPPFAAGNDLVVLLPEQHEGVKGTFLVFHTYVPR